MLVILNDPHGITGRAEHALDYGVTLQANIERHVAGGADCALSINGVEVDPLTDVRLDAPPSVLDRVVVIRRPAGVDPVTVMLIASLILSVYSIAMMPKLSGDPVAQDSPNNRLTGQTNIARTYQAIPDVYGYRRVWPDLIQQSEIVYIAHVKYVTEWLCVSRGKGTITEINYADTPLLGASGVAGSTFQAFEPAASPSAYPELNDTTLTAVYEPFESPNVNGQEIGLDFAAEAVSRTAATFDAPGGTDFDITMTDGVDLADLKALAPAGLARLAFFVQLESGPDIYENVDEVCTVLAYLVTGPNVTLTFRRAAGFLFPVATDSVDVQLYAASTTSNTIGPFTLPVDAEIIRWNMVFLRGLKGTVVINAEWWEIDGAGAEVVGTREDADFTYAADTFDQQFFTSEATPTAGLGRYKIQFTRSTADLANGADVAKLEKLYAVRYYATKTLPGVTVIKVRTKATDQATGIRDRRFNLRWNRHVRTLSATTLSASRNFARAMAHLWCVAGEDLAQLDTTTLAAINAEFGETADVLRFDGTFDDANMSLGERLQRIAYTARCAVWRDGTQWTVTREQARTTPEVQLDYRNLAASGDSGISYAAHLPASRDGVEVEYTDETTQATKAYIRLSVASGAVVAGTPTNALTIKLPGCATETQADNRAQLEARRLLYQRTNVQDTALSDGGQIGLGTLVRWIDPHDFAGDDGLQAGEVMTIVGTLITTSEVLDWRGETTGRMLFTGVDGLTLGAPIVVTPHASGAVTLASAPAGLFVADDDRQCGSRYAFGPGLTEAETEAAGLYVATRVSPNGDGTYSIALANYDDRLYEED